TAPLIALTALAGDALGAFALEDGRRQIAELTITEHSPLRGLSLAEAASRHRLLVIGHFPSTGPDRFLADLNSEARLVAGDVLVVCGEPRDLAGLLAQTSDEVLPHVLWAGWLRRQARVLRQTLAEVDLAVKICTGVLLSVILLSTCLYRFWIIDSNTWVEQKPWADALYRTISVMATGA